jgi:DNA helicase HerA-like ATPase
VTGVVAFEHQLEFPIRRRAITPVDVIRRHAATDSVSVFNSRLANFVDCKVDRSLLAATITTGFEREVDAMADVDADGTVFVGRSSKPEVLTLAMANRHGLVTGATGTGKTVTLQVLAEGLSRAGVSVFAADIKGDLSGISELGEAKDAFVSRAKSLGLDYQPDQFPVVFWDLFGEQGHPIRATISEVGPLLLSRLMDLNEVQEGVLNICFRVADEQGLLVLDLKDLRAMLGYISDHAAELTAHYGNVSKATIGTIQRALLVLENQGGNQFFGEPALELKDFIRSDRDGRGYVNILAADKLMSNPRLYATFLLWLLSELFEQLPEVGDQPKPKLCFFFDEAHLLFTDAPKALLDKIEQVVRLIRSKGVGVYFVTQNPLDVPDKVLAQLGNRVQHALRAFTPRDQKAVRAAAETFRPNPKLDTAKVIMELGKGEALVSFLEGNATPSMVERCMIRPPSGRVGPISTDERKALMAKSLVKGKYDQAIDRESAYEVLQKRMQSGTDVGPMDASSSPGKTAEASAAGGFAGVMAIIMDIIHSIFGTGQGRRTRLTRGQLIARQVTRSVSNQIAGKIAADIGKSIGGKAGSSVGRAIVRGTMGGILRR